VKKDPKVEKTKMEAIFKSVCETIEHEENYTK
jgi:hypothetical protein